MIWTLFVIVVVGLLCACVMGAALALVRLAVLLVRLAWSLGYLAWAWLATGPVMRRRARG